MRIRKEQIKDVESREKVHIGLGDTTIFTNGQSLIGGLMPLEVEECNGSYYGVMRGLYKCDTMVTPPSRTLEFKFGSTYTYTLDLPVLSTKGIHYYNINVYFSLDLYGTTTSKRHIFTGYLNYSLLASGVNSSDLYMTKMNPYIVRTTNITSLSNRSLSFVLRCGSGDNFQRDYYTLEHKNRYSIKNYLD